MEKYKLVIYDQYGNEIHTINFEEYSDQRAIRYARNVWGECVVEDAVFALLKKGYEELYELNR